MSDIKKRGPIVVSSEHASGRDLEGSSLVPMLIAGLFFVLMGAVVVMFFV